MDVDVKMLDRWHRERGFLSCGYHYVIKRNGAVEIGRAEADAGAHCQGYNFSSIGVCLVGGLGADGKISEVNYTEKQWEALKALLFDLEKRYPQAKVYGHNNFTKGKTCPNFDVPAWWQRIKSGSGTL